MVLDSFIWTDLATYNLGRAETDYAALFGWHYRGSSAYRFAFNGDHTVAALFKMPKRLAKMNLPAFWMSYIHVEDIQAAVDRAKRHAGVIIEVEPEPFDDRSEIALIRDPSGAGFTVYQGPNIAPPANSTSPGQVMMRYHHTSDLARLTHFYADMFGWRFEPVPDAPWPAADIYHRNGERLACIEQVPEAIRGKYSYWMPCFAVADMAAFSTQLTRLQGTLLHELPKGRYMAADRQQAHFMVQVV